MSGAASFSHSPVEVNFNVTVDASGNIEVFNTTKPVVGNVIVAEQTLPVTALYNEATNKGLLEFWEPSDVLGDIKVQLANTNLTSSGGLNFTDAYQVSARAFASGVQAILNDTFDCSGAAPFNNYSAHEEYYKQDNFGRVALATYAHHLFGHIDATAAITNDAAFVRGILSLDASGNWSKTTTAPVKDWSTTSSGTDANLALRLVKAVINKGVDASGNPTTSSVSDNNAGSLANIVAQVLGQDATRTMNADNSQRTLDQHILLRFYPGDVIYMNVSLKAPNVNVGTNNQSVTKTALEALYPSSNNNFTLKITLAGESQEVVTAAVTSAITTIAAAPTAESITELKSYLAGFSTSNPAPVPTITVTDVPITSLVTTAASSFDTNVTYEVNFVLLTNNTATVDTTNMTENSVLYIPATPGTPITLVADSTSYTITSSGSSVAVNGTSYNLGQKVTIGNKTFVVAFTGSVGLVVQNASPGIAKMATRIGGAATFSTANITTDGAGNVYIRYQTSDGSSHTLYNYSTAPVGAGEVATSVYGTLSGQNAYLVKYNNSGTVQWATVIPTSASHSGSVATLACDSVGNVYLVGQAASDATPYNFTSAPVGGGAIGVTSWGTIPSGPSSAYYPNIWVVKYNSSGSVVWGTMIKGGGESLMPQCAVDSSDNLILTYATSQSPLTLYNYTSAPVSRGTVGLTIYGTMTQPAYTNILVKYNSSGTVAWATSLENTAGDAFTPSSVACDSSGNIIMYAGCSNNKVVSIKNYTTAPVGGGAVGESTYGTVTIANSTKAILIVKYNSSGAAQWATYIAGYSGLNVNVSCDSANNVYVVSNGQMTNLYNYSSAPSGGGAVGLSLYGTIPTSPDWQRCFIAKYNSSGVAQWATRFLGAASTPGRSICDSAGNVYISVRANREAGGTIIPFNFTSAPVNQGFITLTQYGLVPFYDPVTWPGQNDVFLMKYTTNGTCAWVARVGGLLADNFGEIAVDSVAETITIVGGYASNPVYISNFVAKPANSTSNASLETYGTLPDVNTSTGNNLFIVKYGM